MNRIEKYFTLLGKGNKKALITFITAGYPDPKQTLEIMHDLVLSGADIIELGIPFSDPMADGSVIQRASEYALEKGIKMEVIFNIISEFRTKNIKTPIILMGYLNPIEAIGYENFAKKCEVSGVDGVLVVDLPPEEATEFNYIIRNHGQNQIFLVSPITKDERLDKICKISSGFLYYVSLKGVTGSSNIDIKLVEDKIKKIGTKTDLPLVVGFGIKDSVTAQKIGKISDGIVIGSTLVEKITNSIGNKDKMTKDISLFVRSLRISLDKLENN